MITAVLWSDLKFHIGYVEAGEAMLVLAVFSFALWALFRLLLNGWIRASLATGMWSFFLLNGSEIIDFMPESSLVKSLIYVLVLFILVDLTRRIPGQIESLFAVNFWTNVLLILPVLFLCLRTAQGQIWLEETRNGAQFPSTPLAALEMQSGPDVWHLVFDRYGDRETLLQAYDVDNSDFYDALRARGFEVPEYAFANYQRTAHSLASTLNADYLDHFSGKLRYAHDPVPLYNALGRNRALSTFKQNGYLSYWSGSWWNPTRVSDDADRNINFRALPQLVSVVFRRSFPGLIAEQLGLPFGDVRKDQCLRVHYKFDALVELARNEDRKYIFAHFLVPHPPYVINADGTCRSLAVARGATRSENYSQQLSYTNDRILQLVDQIIAGPRPSVILIHADEGPWPEPHIGNEDSIGTDPVKINWHTLSVEKKKQKLGILMATRLVDGSPHEALSTPVNLYPFILNREFGQSLGMREDRVYMFQDPSNLYTFKEVTTETLSDRSNHPNQ
ncbi:sulfatase-like hydrolase/transferase [Altererythrobacter sp. MF3-039]|uniref:sulfatase-like hydrolase/transferase n=1 Tax=Altererythrobacter sp. MF3-039 TaxID=3252901 RepID=UPI00390CD820